MIYGLCHTALRLKIKRIISKVPAAPCFWVNTCSFLVTLYQYLYLYLLRTCKTGRRAATFYRYIILEYLWIKLAIQSTFKRIICSRIQELDGNLAWLYQPVTHGRERTTPRRRGRVMRAQMWQWKSVAKLWQDISNEASSALRSRFKSEEASC